MLTLPEIARSRYLLHRALSDVFGTHRACLAVDVLLGPELDQVDDDALPGEEVGLDAPDEFPPFTPSEEDLADYAEWSARLEATGQPWPAEYPAAFTDADLTAAGLAVG